MNASTSARARASTFTTRIRVTPACSAGNSIPVSPRRRRMRRFRTWFAVIQYGLRNPWRFAHSCNGCHMCPGSLPPVKAARGQPPITSLTFMDWTLLSGAGPPGGSNRLSSTAAHRDAQYRIISLLCDGNTTFVPPKEKIQIFAAAAPQDRYGLSSTFFAPNGPTQQ